MNDAYLAGLFDGEGCITLAVQRMSKGYPCYNVQAVALIGMTTPALPLLMAIQAQYGGTTNTTIHSKPGWQPYTCIKWRSKADVTAVLTRIEPYLTLKREQAKLALWWAEMAIIDPIAKNMFIADLKAMKGNMMLTADATIGRIQEHLKDNKVVSIR